MGFLKTFNFKRLRNRKVSLPTVVANTAENQQSANLYYPAVIGLTGLVTIGDTPGSISDNQISAQNSPINLAGYEMYTFLRGKNSSLGAYSASDLIKYHLAIYSVYAEVIKLERDIALILKTSTFNAANPYGFIYYFDEGRGYDCASVTSNLSNIISKINVITEKLNRFIVTSDWHFGKQMLELAKTVYTDEKDTDVTAFIVPEISGLYWNIQVNEELTGALTYFDLMTGYQNQSIINRLNVLDKYLDALSIDEDVNNLSAEISHALGEQASTLNLPMITEESIKSAVTFECSIDMLERVRNATIYALVPESQAYRYGIQENDQAKLVQGIDPTSNLGIGQHRISFRGTRGSANYIAPNTPQVALYTSSTNPSDEEIENALYFKNIAKALDLSAGASVPTLRGLGTVTLYDFDIVYFDNDWNYYSYHTINYGESSAATAAGLRIVDCLPDLYFLSISGDAYSGVARMISGSTDVYSIFEESQIIQAKNILTMSAFGFTVDSASSNSDSKSDDKKKSKPKNKKKKKGNKPKKQNDPKSEDKTE